MRLLLLNGLLAVNLDPQAPLVEYPPLWHVAHGFRHALAFHVVRASNAVPILARFLDTKCGATRRDWVYLYLGFGLWFHAYLFLWHPPKRFEFFYTGIVLVGLCAVSVDALSAFLPQRRRTRP